MQQNYKRLGDYIRLVDVRNKNLDVQTLLGVSIQKKLMPSIANTVGTDMSNYKIIQRNQFAYGTVTSRNGDKISIALLKEFEKAIVSQIYLVFEIKDTAELLPDYLMMWFRRPEFDRYARYKSHGSARETFDWNEMIETELPIPSIEKQKELVAEYQTIENRMRLNNELCQKLEETAQTVYRHWFEDFEFPVIARGEAQQNDEAISTNHILQVAESTAEYQNRSELVAERSRSYKSSGGEMVYSEELGREIPKGWKVETIKEISKEIITGKTPPTHDSENYGSFMPFLTIPDMHNKIFVYEYSKWISKKGVSTQKNKTLPKNAICVSCIGTPGLVVIADEKLHTNQQINNIILKDELSLYYFFFALRGLSKTIIDFGMGAAVLNNLNKDEFSKLPVLVPSKEISQRFNMEMIPIFDKIKISLKQNIKLEELKNLLLGKMAVEEKN